MDRQDAKARICEGAAVRFELIKCAGCPGVDPAAPRVPACPRHGKLEAAGCSGDLSAVVTSL